MAVGTVQRAYQVAPECRSIDGIRRKLKREGHSAVDEHLHGNSIQNAVKLLLKQG